jgi:phosphoenolpyruvate-protein phosphotransferase (PTS system enzyme I)
LTPLIVGLGVDEQSASPGLVPRVKKAVQTLNAKQCAHLAAEIRIMTSANEILAKCEAVARDHYPELLTMSGGAE